MAKPHHCVLALSLLQWLHEARNSPSRIPATINWHLKALANRTWCSLSPQNLLLLLAMVTDLLLLLRLINSTTYFIPSVRGGNHWNVVLRDRSYIVEQQNTNLLNEEVLGGRESPRQSLTLLMPMTQLSFYHQPQILCFAGRLGPC